MVCKGLKPPISWTCSVHVRINSNSVTWIELSVVTFQFVFFLFLRYPSQQNMGQTELLTIVHVTGMYVCLVCVCVIIYVVWFIKAHLIKTVDFQLLSVKVAQLFCSVCIHSGGILVYRRVQHVDTYDCKCIVCMIWVYQGVQGMYYLCRLWFIYKSSQ